MGGVKQLFPEAYLVGDRAFGWTILDHGLARDPLLLQQQSINLAETPTQMLRSRDINLEAGSGFGCGRRASSS